MLVKTKRLRPNAKIPTMGSKHAAGCDLYACLDHDIMSIAAHQTVKIHTGIATEIPDGYFGAVFARSGLATKSGLRPANCVGVIDSDYRGEIIVSLHNDTDVNQSVENGERVAQLVILPYMNVEYREVDELSDTERGDGGFGSTGTKEVRHKKKRGGASEQTDDWERVVWAKKK